MRPTIVAGVLVLDKPTGISSREALDRVVAVLRGAKMGHAGTLDPMASGVLVVCIGKATRLIPYVQRMTKCYSATLRFGQRSSTHDLESPIEEVPFAGTVDAESLERTLIKFRGAIEQVPPQHSAVHVRGRRAYELARAGAPVALQPRPVRIDRLGCTRFEYPHVELDIRCSSGTYVRSLVRDIGDDLACGAVLTVLVRTAVGPFRLADAMRVDQLDHTSVSDRLLPVSAAVRELPAVQVPADRRADVFHGRPIPAPPDRSQHPMNQEFALCDDCGAILAVAELDPVATALRPRIVLMQDEAG